MRVARLIALGFVIGAIAHSAGLVLLLLGRQLYGPHYPWWRHAAMVVTDLTIGAIAMRHPRWLIAALCAFLLEQVAVNGFGPTAVFVTIAIAAHTIVNSASFGGHDLEAVRGEAPIHERTSESE